MSPHIPFPISHLFRVYFPFRYTFFPSFAFLLVFKVLLSTDISGQTYLRMFAIKYVQICVYPLIVGWSDSRLEPTFKLASVVFLSFCHHADSAAFSSPSRAA